MITIYTDGACSGNPGSGGFGVVVYEDEKLITSFSKYTKETTNNREELKAIISALEFVSTLPSKESFTVEEIKIYSDSAYCVNICNNWIYSWEKNNWTRSKGQKIENLDLIQNLYKYLIKDNEAFVISIEKVPGHSGIEGNELADKLARGLIKPDAEEFSFRII